jgi:hypothetical protein
MAGRCSDWPSGWLLGPDRVRTVDLSSWYRVSRSATTAEIGWPCRSVTYRSMRNTWLTCGHLAPWQRVESIEQGPPVLLHREHELAAMLMDVVRGGLHRMQRVRGHDLAFQVESGRGPPRPSAPRSSSCRPRPAPRPLRRRRRGLPGPRAAGPGSRQRPPVAGTCERTPVPTGASLPSPARRAAHDHIATPAANRDPNPKTILERPCSPG